jgi:hypothetical protein
MALIAHKGAVDLLLRILGTRSGKISGAMIRANFAEAGDALLKSSLLVKVGQTDVVPSMDEYEDEPTQVTWSPEHESYGHLGSNGQWVPVALEETFLYGVKMETFFAKTLVNFERVSSQINAPLVMDRLWDLGAVKIEGRQKPVSVWFCRRLFDPGHRAVIEEMMNKRPPADARVIFTSTAAGLDVQSAGQVVVGIKDVLVKPDDIAIDPAIVSKRLLVAPASAHKPIRHSVDYGKIYIGEETYTFRGLKHRAILRILVDAYNRNQPVCLTADVLEEVQAGPTTTNLARAFSGNKYWSRFIKEEAGHCWIAY